MRTEVLSLLSRIENLFRYSMIVTATVYAWLVGTAFGLGGLATNVACLKLPRQILLVGWWIPPGFVVLSGILAASSYWRVFVMGSYLRRIELTLGHEALGWERFTGRTRPIMTKAAIWAWTLLLVTTLIATGMGMWVTYEAGIACPQQK